MKTIAASELRRAPYILLAIFIVLAAGIITTGCLYYQHYRENYQLEVESRLSAIAELKVNELVRWRNERLSDAGVFYNNAAFSALVQRFLKTPDDVEAQGQIRTWLSQVQSACKYDRVMLLDTQYSKKMIVPDGPERITSSVSQRASEILRSGKIAFEDFYWNEQNQRIYLKVLVPILEEADDNRPIGIVALRIDPATYLYPFINQWPTPSRTAETLIVRREGNEAVFLNELKFQENTALNLRVPLEKKKELPAVKAVLGQEGIVEGMDYRGVPVIAAVRAVPGSPWFLVARMDISEVYAPIKQNLWVIVILIGTLLTGASAGVGFIWKQQSARFYRQKCDAAGALHESQTKYKTLYESSRDAIMLLAPPSWKFTAGNPAAVELFRAGNEEEFTSNGPWDTSPEYQPDGQLSCEKAKNMIEKAMKEGSNFFEWRHKRLDGEEFPATVLLTRVFLEGGQLLQATVRDITDQKHTEEALLHFQKALESATDAIGMSTPEGRHYYQNKAFTELFGLSVTEVDGASGPPASIYADEKVGREVFDAIMRGDSWTGEVKMLAKGKSKKDILLRAYSIKDKEGKVIGLVGIHTDITERKQAEEALRESEAKYKALFASAAEGIVAADFETKQFRYVNPAMCRMFGYTEEELTRLGVVDIHPKESLDCVQAEFEAQLCGEKTLTTYLPCLRKDGALFYANVSAAPIILDGRKCLVGFFSDISERKQMEEDLRSAKAQAEAANEAKSGFLANMSHEIRTPLNAIIGFSEILACEGLSDEQTEWIRTIRDSGEHLLALINDILDFSKIEAGKMDVEMTECSLKRLCAKVESLMRPAAMKKGLEFGFRENGVLPARIRTDHTRLSQCLLNLVNNAVKFTEQGHVYVNISMEEVDDEPCIRFDVEDTGIGIPLEKQQLIFESFTQADSSTTRRFGGSGLGLAITKRLAELLGGRVSLTSEEGKGSVFSLIVPVGVGLSEQAPSGGRELADGSSVVQSISAAPDPRSRGDAEFKFTGRAPRGRALVAEDAVTNQMLIKVMLERMGLEATMVKDGAEAVREGLAQSYDLIFMDIQMPNMNGYEAARRLRKKGLTTPIIALTANAMEGDDKKCIEAGCDDYLPKPIERAKLMEIIRKYLTPQPQDLGETIDSVKSGVDDLGRLCSKDAAPQADSADADSAEDVIDWDQLISRVVEEGIAGEIVPLCVADNRERLEMLAEAVRAGNAEDVKLYAHAIKGSAGNIGARQLSDVAAQLEHRAFRGDLSQAEQLLQAIKTEFARLESFVSNPDWVERAKRQSSGKQAQ